MYLRPLEDDARLSEHVEIGKRIEKISLTIDSERLDDPMKDDRIIEHLSSIRFDFEGGDDIVLSYNLFSCNIINTPFDVDLQDVTAGSSDNAWVEKRDVLTYPGGNRKTLEAFRCRYDMLDDDIVRENILEG